MVEHLLEDLESERKRAAWAVGEARRLSNEVIPHLAEQAMESVAVERERGDGWRALVKADTLELERLRAGLRAIAECQLPCRTCGHIHQRTVRRGFTTWEDPDDGHSFFPESASVFAQRLISGDSGAQT